MIHSARTVPVLVTPGIASKGLLQKEQTEPLMEVPEPRLSNQPESDGRSLEKPNCNRCWKEEIPMQ